MKTDLQKDKQILGLSEGFSSHELKKAFRAKSKLFHPDRNSDSLQSHLAMIRLNQAYSNLAKAVESEEGKDAENHEVSGKTDQSYRIYKEGIEKFQKIHPSQWKSNNRNIFNPHAVETDPKTLEILDNLIRSMAEAYHCFAVVANEYSKSSWAGDAKAKMKELEKMTIRYARIRESYMSEID